MRSRMIIKLCAVLVATSMMVLAGCASTGGGAPQSTDVLADVATEGEILKALSSNSTLNTAQIGVSCVNGVVTLRGQVETDLERGLAAQVAESVTGVSNVVNLLTTSR